MSIMTDHIDQVNMNNAKLSANTFCVKEEEDQEDCSVEDKVCITETAVTTGRLELQGTIDHGKIKQYEEPTCMNNIKTELATVKANEIQNDNVKMEDGISANDIKIEFDSRLLYCEHCEAYYVDYCTKCGMLVQILNKYALNNTDSGARKDIPNNILEIKDCFGHTGIYALRIIPAGVKLGPMTGLGATECPWKIRGEKFVLDKSKSMYLNWMQYVNPTRNACDQNLHVFQSKDGIYYQSTRQIQTGDELLVYFSEKYGNSPNKIIRVEFVTTTKHIFACTFCCLGFSSKLHLAKHKTICFEGSHGKFSIEELMQCPFCKIHLDPKEYFEHHMAFCSKRNTRNGILPTPPAEQGTAALHGRKKYLRTIYKCEQCKYRTKYQADLKEHIEQHYEVKMYKCGICKRRFKIKESLRLHVENAHPDVARKEDQEHATADYMNTHIKVEHSSSRDQKKIFKCSLCVFRTKDKQYLIRRHIKTKHLKQFDFKCDSCEFRTNHKANLDVHVKTKHLKEFEFKCDSCEFRTNTKSFLNRHVKTKHLKQFDFKCESCEFETNIKSDLKRHIKRKHLKEFDYKCDSCEFETIDKHKLECHIKTKHLKEFEYKCDSCEFRTNNKSVLNRHVKTKHLKQFDFKCDSCEFGTNFRTALNRHIKTKHLNNKFDYKCEKCEFATNRKDNLDGHIKTKHWKQFDYKCDSCEFGTNSKTNLKIHAKTKHLNEFDFKCDSCEFKTNRKDYLEMHVKTKHLKQFDFKCYSCEYGTNHKADLDVHVKTKHLKEFQFKCDSCEFRTNNKSFLNRHVKTKHLKQFDFKCQSCEFETNIKCDLKRHIKRKHLNEFDYSVINVNLKQTTDIN